MKLSRYLPLFTGVVAASMLAGSASAANISINASIGVLKSADGSTPLAGGTFVFISDADGDGLGTVGTTNSYGTDDPGDVVLGTAKINEEFFGVAAFFSGTFGPFTVPDNSQVYGVFFDNDFDTSTAAPGEGTDFGIVPVALNVTGNASGLPFQYQTNEVPFTGTQDPSTLFANAGSVVPEPASLALLGLGGLLVARRRR